MLDDESVCVCRGSGLFILARLIRDISWRRLTRRRCVCIGICVV